MKKVAAAEEDLKKKRCVFQLLSEATTTYSSCGIASRRPSGEYFRTFSIHCQSRHVYPGKKKQKKKICRFQKTTGSTTTTQTRDQIKTAPTKSIYWEAVVRANLSPRTVELSKRSFFFFPFLSLSHSFKPVH